MVVKQKIDEEAFQNLAHRKGLCNTCTHEPSCVFPRDTERPVRFCDEFEGERLEPKVAVVLSEVKREPREPEEGRPSVGLCAYCDRWSTCTYPKSEGGVWRCEEYL